MQIVGADEGSRTALAIQSEDLLLLTTIGPLILFGVWRLVYPDESTWALRLWLAGLAYLGLIWCYARARRGQLPW